MLFLTITASRLEGEPFVQIKLSPKSHSDFRPPRSIDDAPSPPSQHGSLLKRFSASSQCWTAMRNPGPSGFWPAWISPGSHADRVQRKTTAMIEYRMCLWADLTCFRLSSPGTS
jgi:hypothetical protein